MNFTANKYVARVRLLRLHRSIPAPPLVLGDNPLFLYLAAIIVKTFNRFLVVPALANLKNLVQGNNCSISCFVYSALLNPVHHL